MYFIIPIDMSSESGLNTSHENSNVPFMVSLCCWRNDMARSVTIFGIDQLTVVSTCFGGPSIEYEALFSM